MMTDQMTHYSTWLCAAAVVLLGMLHPFALSAQPETSTENLLEKLYEKENEAETLVETDTNGDGQDDYFASTNEAGKKSMEVRDYNHDGFVDDFYFYSDGILQKRAVDTNYDRHIDLWVYIQGGIYIDSYKRDTNFDGKFDTTKEFGKEEQKVENSSAEPEETQ